MTLPDDQHNTHALPFPQVHKFEIGNRLVYKRYETLRTGEWAKGPYYTIREAAGILRYSYETVRQLVHKGKLKGYQHGFACAIRIAHEHLIEFMERQQCPGQENPHASSAFVEKTTGTSVMGGKSTAQALRMRERLNAS